MTIEEILAGESKNVEFKENLPEKSIKYMKSVVAFANGTGGKIIFGIADKTREVVGFDQEDVFKKMDAIANAVSDSCEPTIIPDITLQTVAGKTVIVVDVSEGRQRPYYIKALGRDGGVYVRVAGTTRIADEYMVKELLFEGSNRYYDQALCTGLNVTGEDIDALCKAMKEQAVKNARTEEQKASIKDVGRQQLRSWGILIERDEKDYPSNAVAILTGNLFVALPGNFFPYDMLGGIFMALCLLYIMWHKYLFDISNRIVIGCIYSVALAVSLLPVFNFNHNAEWYLGSVLPEIQQKVIVLVLGFTGWSLFVFYLARKMAEGIMQRQNRKQIEVLRRFQNESASILRQEDLFKLLVGVVNEMFPVKDIFVFIKNGEKFTVVKTAGGQMPDQAEQDEITAMLERSGAGECSEISLMKYDDEIQGFIYIKSEKRTRLNYLERDYYWRIGVYAGVCLKNISTYQEVYQISIHDELTGLYNRGYFKKFLAENWKEEQKIALMYLDLDDFKLFNELYGEECGDRILKWCGHIIENTVGSKGETFRFGSNEYVVLINSDEKKKVAQIAAKIQKNFLLADEEKPDVLQPVTASVGIAFYPDTASGADELLSQAERANFYAKRDGKNCIKIYGAHTEDELEDQQVQGFKHGMSKPVEHSCHVSDYAVLLAKKIGLEPNDIEIAKEAGLLHDIGKIGIPESILKKQGRLNDEEYEIMKTHVTNSIEMIHFLPNMNYVIPAVLSHHERYDGKGYPDGLKGEEIPLYARIIAIADSYDAMKSRKIYRNPLADEMIFNEILGRILAVCDSFDAMTTKRTYKEAMSIDYAISELERNKGTQFDPKLAEAFIELLKEGKIEV